MEHQPQFLEAMTWPELDQALRDEVPLLLPLGSVEQHGPHLPIGTDAYIAHGLAERVARVRPGIVAPSVLYTSYSRPRSGGGRSFVGSTGMPLGVVSDVLRYTAKEFFRQGVKRLLVINGHFENEPAAFDGLQSALEEAPDSRVVLLNWWDLLEPSDIDDIFDHRFPGWEAEHASLLETALMQSLHPELVREDLRAAGGAPRPVRYDVLPTPADTVAGNGIGWTATTATPELGSHVVSMVVDRLCRVMDTEFGG